jgi:hypothetical protein
MATAILNFFKIRYQRYAAVIRIPNASQLGNRLGKKIEDLPSTC